MVFHPLNEEQIKGIAGIQLDRLNKRLAENSLSMEISDEAMTRLAEVGFDPVYGAPSSEAGNSANH